MIDSLRKFISSNESWKHMPQANLERFLGPDNFSEPITSKTSFSYAINDAFIVSMINNHIFDTSENFKDFFIYSIDNAASNSALVDKVLNKSLDTQTNPFIKSSINDYSAGYVIYIPPGKSIDMPIYLHNLNDTRKGSLLSKIIIVCDEGSSVEIIDHSIGSDSLGYINTFLDIFCNQGSELRYTLISDCKSSAMINSNVDLLSESRIIYNALSINSNLYRNNMVVDLLGSEANAELSGLFFSKDNNHMEFHTQMNHSSRDTSSTQNYRGILSDSSSGLFNGLVNISKEGVGSIANQSNKNIIFGDRARMNSNPQLIIETDDVQCSHGSTTGQVDDDALFYLRSRGISIEQAYEMVVSGFSSEIFSNIANKELNNYIVNLISKSVAMAVR